MSVKVIRRRNDKDLIIHIHQEKTVAVLAGLLLLASIALVSQHFDARRS